MRPPTPLFQCRDQVEARYDSEAMRYPLLAEKVPKELYVKRNWRPRKVEAEKAERRSADV